MSKLSEAVGNIAQAAADLKDAAAAIKAMTEAANQGIVPQTETAVTMANKTLAAAATALPALEEKMTALIGHLGALVKKGEAIVVQVRGGAWLELKDVGFGGDLRVEGRVRIAPPEQ